MTAPQFSQALDPFLPKGTSSKIFEYLKDEKVRFKITRERKTKFGDFRAVPNQAFQTITINGNLNIYAFLITFIHEIAHLKVFKSYKQRVAPHGKEWKVKFQELMSPFLTEEVFPKEILSPLKNYMLNPKASSSSDHNLFKALMSFNEGENPITVLDIKEGERFNYRGKIFEKGKKRRTRYICYLLPTKKPFLFSGLAPVEVIKS